MSNKYTESLNEKIKADPSATSWSLNTNGGSPLYSYERRAALQVAAKFDLTLDYGAAVIDDRTPIIVVVKKGLDPYTQDYQSAGVALTGNLPGRQDREAKIDRSDPIFCIAQSHIKAMEIGNKEKSSDFEEMKYYFERGDADSLKHLLGYQ